MLYSLETTQLVVNPIHIDNLNKLRQEWEDTGADLMTVKTPVALFLYDVCRSLDLSPDDTAEVLGDLYGIAIS